MSVSFVRRRRSLVVITAAAVLLASSAFAAAPQSTKKKNGMPEVYHGKARVQANDATGDVYVSIQLDSYTPEKDRKVVEDALKTGGSDAFVEALRKSPIAGHLEIGQKTFTIRWARKVPAEKGNTITLVVDSPIYFVGAGMPGAKSRAGYDVGVIQLEMDSSNTGRGSMAPAAKVKPGGATGVEVEDYGSQPVKLVSVMRVIS